MGYMSADGIKQTTASSDLTCISTRDFISKLGDAAGSSRFKVVDSADAERFGVDSDGNTAIVGNLAVAGNLSVTGTQSVVNSTAVWIGDSEITLNSGASVSAENSYGGLAVKRVDLAAAINATSFVAGTSTINVSDDPTGIIAADDLIYVDETTNNDGLYEVASITTGTIVIKTGSTVPGTKNALVTETAAGKVNIAKPAFLQWSQASTMWEFGYYNVLAARKAFKAVGIGAGGAAAFSDTNPDLSATGTSAANSGAKKIGVFAEFTYSTATDVQAVLNDLDAAIVSAGTPTKAGVSAGITGGATSLAVTFGTAFGTSCDGVSCNLLNTVDATPDFFAVMITARSASGFTATFSGAIPGSGTTNYKLSWTAVGL